MKYLNSVLMTILLSLTPLAKGCDFFSQKEIELYQITDQDTKEVDGDHTILLYQDNKKLRVPNYKFLIKNIENASKIIENYGLSVDQKLDNIKAYHKSVIDMGILKNLGYDTLQPTEKLAQMVINMFVWSYTHSQFFVTQKKIKPLTKAREMYQFGRHAWNQPKISVDRFYDQTFNQVSRHVKDNILGIAPKTWQQIQRQLWDQIKHQFHGRFKIKYQITDILKESASELIGVIIELADYYTFAIYQIAGFALLHSPKLTELRIQLEKELDHQRSESFLCNLTLPESKDSLIFTQLKTISMCISKPMEENLVYSEQNDDTDDNDNDDNGNDDNGNDDNGNDDNGNDDNGNDDNGNDDNGNDDNGNDDNGNDNNGNDNNENDNNGNDNNENDNNGNDDNGNDDNGNDDNGNDDNGTDNNENDDNGNIDNGNIDNENDDNDWVFVREASY